MNNRSASDSALDGSSCRAALEEMSPNQELIAKKSSDSIPTELVELHPIQKVIQQPCSITFCYVVLNKVNFVPWFPHLPVCKFTGE